MLHACGVCRGGPHSRPLQSWEQGGVHPGVATAAASAAAGTTATVPPHSVHSAGKCGLVSCNEPRRCHLCRLAYQSHPCGRTCLQRWYARMCMQSACRASSRQDQDSHACGEHHLAGGRTWIPPSGYHHLASTPTEWRCMPHAAGELACCQQRMHRMITWLVVSHLQSC